ncbi:phage tail sheath family protein [Lentibacillus sp. Marseille-P4043]|uniref:phage tail sheath family protein n=1 Tax=Lentibacillus sp. Marseille-P4043 TaxID=2040293 RepID=UPI000D0B5E35|nr:phage tail protein [Lentibacillus sp. Marseille-P4043]
MSYKHGITVQENPTTLEQPIESLSSLQVAFGTAPINMAEDIDAVVNKPIKIQNYEEAKAKLGYSDNWESYTLCEVMDASFRQIKAGPVVFVNVIDPEMHKKSVSAESIEIVEKEAKIEKEGILLDSLVLKNKDGATTYVKDTDYIADFDNEGNVVISALSGGAITDSTNSLQADFDQLDPSKVTNEDVIGGYDSTTNEYKGIETVSTIFPKLDSVPTILFAPGFSKDTAVGAALASKSEGINGSFKTENVLDVEGNSIDEAIEDKYMKIFEDKSSMVCWPKVKIRGKVYWLSSILAPVLSRTDAENGDVPYKSPSNKRVPVEAGVTSDGKEMFLDQLLGNRLNGKGIVTAINMRGWRIWGNNTAMYDYDIHQYEVPDPKDRFIAVRRMFNWWGNTFILNYFDEVDDPTSYRLIENAVDSENIRANGFQARGQIAGAKIEFKQSENPTSQILDGKIKFTQKIGFLTPAKEIENELEFDPTILTNSLFRGEQ